MTVIHQAAHRRHMPPPRVDPTSGGTMAPGTVLIGGALATQPSLPPGAHVEHVPGVIPAVIVGPAAPPHAHVIVDQHHPPVAHRTHR